VAVAGIGRAQTLPADVPPDERAPDALTRYDDVFTDDDANWYNLDAPTSPDAELDDIFTPGTAMFRVPFIDGPIDFLLDQQRALRDATGLRVGLAYIHLFQHASGGPGERYASAGDLDLILDWTLIGRGTENTGRLFFSVEERFRAGPIPPNPDLRRELGVLASTTGAFNDRGLVIRDAFWDQRLFEGRLRVLVGRGAPDDYAGSHRLQSSVNGFFNGNLSGNITTPWPGHGPLALVSTRPTELFYATLGGANAYSTTTESTIENLFDEGKVFGFGETGITPEFTGLGRGRYAITAWYMPERDLNDQPHDWGFSLTAEQYLSNSLWVYARFGYADEGLTGVESAWQAAVAYDGLLGSPDNVTAIGIGYAEPANSNLREETSIDAFHRFQLTQHIQFSVGAQMYINPASDPDTDTLGVFSARLRVDL
jgi:porin